MKLIVEVKHFIRLKPASGHRPEEIRYDYDDRFFFFYDGKTLRVQGSSWSKNCTPDEVADVIQGFFKGMNYHIKDIDKYD